MKRLICPQDEARAIAELKAGETIVVRREIKPAIEPRKTSYRPVGDGIFLFSCNGVHTFRRPTYPAGTEVWVAETWRGADQQTDGGHCFALGSLFYKADEPWNDGAGWKSPAVIPQWASRSRLVVREDGVEGGQWRYLMEKMG